MRLIERCVGKLRCAQTLLWCWYQKCWYVLIFMLLETMYSIVHFINEGSVEVVPTIWLKTKNGKSDCFWPPKQSLKGQALAKALEKCLAPDARWELHPAEILKATGGHDWFFIDQISSDDVLL